MKCEVFTIEKRRTKKKRRINKKILISACGILLIASFTFVYFFQNRNTSNNNAPQTQEQQNTQNSETPAPEQQTPTPEKKPDAEQKAPTAPGVSEPPTGPSTPSISKDAPKLSIELASKVEIGMTTNDVKSVIGAKVFDDALKAGGNLTGLTINIPGTNGGIVIGFDDDRVHSITRTYQLKANTKESLKAITKGMSMEEVKTKFGAAATENGKKGTVVFIYKYTENGEIIDVVVAFDENNKVLVVS